VTSIEDITPEPEPEPESEPEEEENVEEAPEAPEAIEVEGIKMTFEKPVDTQLDLF